MVLGRRGFTCLIALLLISAGVIAVPARAQSGPNDPGFEFQWGLSQVGAQDAWAIGKGRGTTVAVLDTGVDFNHEDLNGQVAAGGRDFTNDDTTAQDDNGQGTHVAGIVAASTNNGTGVAGIAHQTKILPIKVLDGDANGFEHHVLDGIQLAISKKVQVLVLDLEGGIVLTDGGFRFEDAIRAAWDAGIVPVLSADHSLVRSRQFSDAPALVVGPVTRDGAASPNSDGVGAAQWGISAPGGSGAGNENDIFSTFFAHREIGREYGRYAYEAGSIQAAAHVAGAAAILRGLGQSPQQTVERLMSSATDAGATGKDRLYGAGLLHAGKSVRGLPAEQPPPSGSGPATSVPPASAAGSGSSAGGRGAAPAQPGRADPVSPEGPRPNSTGASPAPGAVPGDAADSPLDDPPAGGGDAVGGLVVREHPQDASGRTPLLPLIGLLVIVGSGTITWALRRRGVDPPPINS